MQKIRLVIISLRFLSLVQCLYTCVAFVDEATQESGEDEETQDEEPAESKCVVGESFVPGTAGLCNSVKRDVPCGRYCKQKYRDEYLGFSCVDRPSGGNRRMVGAAGPSQSSVVKECRCQLKCCRQGSWGDPHYWTCDGTKFGYQGLSEHYLVKPCKKYSELPNFEIRQTNKFWRSGPMSSLNTCTLVIPEWNAVVEVTAPKRKGKPSVKVNGKQLNDFPLHWESVQDYTANTIDIALCDENERKKKVVIETSFGLRITMDDDLMIETPRHPDLKGKMCGLIGRWDDVPENDAIDANGKRQRLDRKFSCEFGDSWIVPGKRMAGSCSQYESRRRAIALENQEEKVDHETKQFITTLCTFKLQSLQNCTNQLGLPDFNVEDCINDLSLISDNGDRINYVKDLVDKFSAMCKTKAKFVPPPIPEIKTRMNLEK